MHIDLRVCICIDVLCMYVCICTYICVYMYIHIKRSAWEKVCEKRKNCAHEETTTERGEWRGKSRVEKV